LAYLRLRNTYLLTYLFYLRAQYTYHMLLRLQQYGCFAILECGVPVINHKQHGKCDAFQLEAARRHAVVLGLNYEAKVKSS